MEQYTIDRLDKFNTNEKIINLLSIEKNINGILDLSRFINLEEFYCYRIHIKKIINLVKSSNNIGVFDILINILDYSIWIQWFEDCNVLKYYWDDELLKRIIDTNKNKLYSKILLNYTDSNLFDNLKPHLICLTDSYVLNYNYTSKIITKRSEQLNLLIGELVENFILTDYFGCENLILILGNNRIANNLIQITKTNTIITFYPNKQITLKIKSGIRKAA